MSPITLCVIVRDEEALLAGCLQSARSAVERMLVVDTGSRDRSREIAREHGATVVEHAWADDFAAARNAALAHVADGWILVLDADERLAPDAARALRAAARRGDFDCGLLPLSNAAALDTPLEDVLSGRSRRGEPVLLPRLLRRTPDLSWEGIVHESVDAWVLRGRRRVVRVEAPIVHYGQVPAVRAARGKDARNLRLLERRVAAAPDDAIARNYLAREQERAGNQSAALAESARAWDSLLAARRRGLALASTAVATLRAFLLLRARRLGEVRAVLEQAAAFEPEHPNLDLLTGVLEENVALAARGENEYSSALARAELALERCLLRRGSAYACELLPGATDWAAATRLGIVRLMRAAPREARASFEHALATHPGHAEAELGRLECRILLEHPQPLFVELEPLLAQPTPDAWILATLACLRLGLTADAMAFARQACVRIEQRPALSPHRTRMLEELLAVLIEKGEAAAVREERSGLAAPGV